MFDIEDYNYELPPGLIAQLPVSKRDGSRMLVVDRETGSLADRHFFDLPLLLRRGDLVVVNDTKVLPARVYGRKESGGRAELLVLQDPNSDGQNPTTRSCLLKSSKRPKKGSLLFFDSGVCGEIQEVFGNGLVSITFTGKRDIDSWLEETGDMPLPPYIKRGRGNPYTTFDRERYQTVFSKHKGAVAAPTAGLHFTTVLVDALKEAGIGVSSLTLHVGHGTFMPVRTKDIREHRLGGEFYRIDADTAEAVTRCRHAGGRIVAVGTTVVRALETAAKRDGTLDPGQGITDLLVTPGYSFRMVNALVTNFHLPKSSLLFLVAAFAGFERAREAYRAAVERDYRFFSYGDAMLIL